MRESASVRWGARRIGVEAKISRGRGAKRVQTQRRSGCVLLQNEDNGREGPVEIVWGDPGQGERHAKRGECAPSAAGDAVMKKPKEVSADARLETAALRRPQSVE